MEFVIKKLRDSDSYKNDIINALEDSFSYNLEEAKEELKNNLNKYLVMVNKNNDDVICFLKTKSLGSKEISINNVVTLNKYRGKGYGSKFLDYLKEKYDSIQLCAIDERAMKFYKKNGFKTTSEILKKDFKSKLTKEEYDEIIQENADGIWKMVWSKIKNKNISKENIRNFGIFNW